MQVRVESESLVRELCPPTPLAEAANENGTPLYVTDLTALADNAAAVEKSFPQPWELRYSLKANHLPEIVEHLAARGWGANVVSMGEWRMAQRAGVANDDVTLEGIGKTDAELAEVVAACVAGEPLQWVALESADEARSLARLADAAGLGAADGPPVDVLLRHNPSVEPETHDGLAVGRADSKFGMTADEIRALHAELRTVAGVRVRGLHVHVGSQLGAVDAWVDGFVRACALIDELDPDHVDLDTVDAGGGFPVGVGSPHVRDFADALDDELRVRGVTWPPRMAIEPGRSLVASAGWLVATVLHVRDRPSGRQVVIDAGMTELIRPALYDARHPVLALGEGSSSEKRVPTRLEGPVCESADHLGTYDLPALRRGDVVTIALCGAYASSLASQYNGRDLAPEVLVEGERLTLARPREQLR